MSFLDDIKNSLKGQSSVATGANQSSLVNAAMAMFGHEQGFSGLAQGFESAGLGHIFGSWVGTGPNQAVSAQQVESAVGQDRIEQFASRAGVPASVAPQLLAGVLPTLVDKLTPDGRASPLGQFRQAG